MVFGIFKKGCSEPEPGSERAPTLARTTPGAATRMRNILGLRELEVMPAQAARAFELASNPEAKSTEFVDIIESDEALSARVLRIANSVYFRRGEAATDIEKAVNSIGLTELRCILSATLLKNLLRIKHPAREQLWANAVGTAIAARALSRYSKKIHENEAFLCGLMHDIGKLVILRAAGKRYEEVIRKVSTGRLSFIQAEEEVFGLNHVEVGKWAAESWRFPKVVVQAIALHHQPWPEDKQRAKKNLTPALLISISDCIVHSSGIGHPIQMRPFQAISQQQLSVAFELLGLRTEEGADFIKRFMSQFEDEYGFYQLESA